MSTQETLLDLFKPPEDHFGHSGALVAMTASEDFLEAAAQQFTGLGRTQRAALGESRLYLLLDPHASTGREAVLPPGRVPGLHEFQPRAMPVKQLLHAKLCLLAFAATRAGPPAHLRLAVLTANLTYGSARQNLELAWRVDVPLGKPARPADRLDVAEAASFLEALLAGWFYRDEERVPKRARRLTRRWDTLLAAATREPLPKGTPRFIHSLEVPLFGQIKKRLETNVDGRNLLLCGSGFYEQPGKRAGEPRVLADLRSMDVFTAEPTRIAVVDPREGGAVARWARQGETHGWSVFEQRDALGKNRRLHAKYVYVGYLRDDHVSNGWMYLGSGNLSQRGLHSSGRDDDGNIECGVVFEVPERMAPEEIEAALFWSPDIDQDSAADWQEGRAGDEPETEELVEAAPILSALIEGGPPRSMRLQWRDDVPARSSVDLRWAGAEWQTVRCGTESIGLCPDDVPAALEIRVGRRSWTVPVVDAAGRTCWKPPRFATYADVIAALVDFPIRPAEATAEEDGDDGIVEDEPPANGAPRSGGASGVEERTYALHAAAELVERVAELQRALPKDLLDDWLDHLDRMLRAEFPRELIEVWRTRRIDVLHHLREPEFRPVLSRTQMKRYSAVLDGAAARWGIR